MKKHNRCRALVTSLIFSSALQSSGDLLVHEQFQDSSLGTESGVGFEAGSTWSFLTGSGSSLFDPLGLNYSDPQGNRLVSSGGAATITSSADESRFGRPLETPIPQGGRADYWVSFLLRLNSPSAGDCFWSPDGAWDVGAIGFQGGATIRLVNGTTSTFGASTGEAALIVMNLKSDTLADIWINPDLATPGTPDILDGLLPTSNVVQAANTILFKINNLNSGSYTFDEYRYGQSFEDVAPFVAGDDPSILVQEQINPPLSQDAVTFDVLVRNPGTTQDLEVSAVSLSGAEASLFTLTSSLPLTVAPGGDGNLQFTFTPNGHIGDVNATAQITSNAALTPTVNLSISGAVSDPEITAPTELVFAPLLDTSPTSNQSISISNAGRTQPLEITGVIIGGEDAASFSLVTTLPLTIPAESAADLEFSLDPSVSIGTISATASITSNDLNKPSLIIDLKGAVNQSNPAPLIEESFTDSDFAGSTGIGFASGAAWSSNLINFTYQPEGLTYEDASGNLLDVSGGAMTIPAFEGGTVRRNLANAIPEGANPDYWISYLIRVDGDFAQTGDAFWSSDGVFDSGAVGFQGSETSNLIRIVNGAATNLPIEGGQTAFVVANLKSATAMDVWVNPDLENPGPPLLADAAISSLVRQANDLVFKFNSQGSTGYTIDEFRYGLNFETVAPIGSDQELTITSFELNDDGNLVLTWFSKPGRPYSIEQSFSLMPGSWEEVDDPVGAANATQSSVNLGLPTTGVKKNFYRVRIAQ